MLTETTLVGNFVNTVVVAVHKLFTARQQAAHIHHHARRGAPTEQFLISQVRLGECRAIKLGFRQHGNGRPQKRRARLHIAGHQSVSGVAAVVGPPQHLHHAARKVDSVANHSVLTWGCPCGNRRQCSHRGGGCNCRDSSALHSGKGRCTAWVFTDSVLELVPAQTIDNQQHHLPCATNDVGEKRRQLVGAPWPEECRHDIGDARTAVVRAPWDCINDARGS